MSRLANIIVVLSSLRTLIAATAPNPNDSNLFLLAYSWQAEFCNGEKYPGCSQPETYWKSHFTLHGLWPQYTDKGYPSFCSKEQLDTTIPDIIGMKIMMQYWPNVQKPVGSSHYDDFWEHEWTKHGTCSGFKQIDYFNTTIRLIQQFGTPTIVSDNVGKYVDTASLRDAFGGKEYVSLQCNSNNHNKNNHNENLMDIIGKLFFNNNKKNMLTVNNNIKANVPDRLEGVYTCWSHNKDSNDVTHRHPLVQTICPSSVQDEDTCHSKNVIIQSFN